MDPRVGWGTIAIGVVALFVYWVIWSVMNVDRHLERKAKADRRVEEEKRRRLREGEDIDKP